MEEHPNPFLDAFTLTRPSSVSTFISPPTLRRVDGASAHLAAMMVWQSSVRCSTLAAHLRVPHWRGSVPDRAGESSSAAPSPPDLGQALGGPFAEAVRC